jgi:hypothetical protein
MIVIIRIRSKEAIDPVWDEIIKQQAVLQKQIKNQGHLLYLTKRLGYHNEASLIAHMIDQAALSDLVVTHLSKIAGVESVEIHHLFRPKFFSLPRDTHSMKRFTIALKIAPAALSDVYKKLIDPNLPDGLKKVYFALTFHHRDDSLQFSLLAQEESILRKYVAEIIDQIPGVLKTSVYTIEKTKPFIAHDDWQRYASQNTSAPGWEQILSQFK